MTHITSFFNIIGPNFLLRIWFGSNCCCPPSCMICPQNQSVFAVRLKFLLPDRFRSIWILPLIMTVLSATVPQIWKQCGSCHRDLVVMMMCLLGLSGCMWLFFFSSGYLIYSLFQRKKAGHHCYLLVTQSNAKRINWLRFFFFLPSDMSTKIFLRS